MILPNSVCGKSPQRSFALFQIKLASVDSVLFGTEAYDTPQKLDH